MYMRYKFLLTTYVMSVLLGATLEAAPPATAQRAQPSESVAPAMRENELGTGDHRLFPTIAKNQTRPPLRLSANAFPPEILIPPPSCEPTETSCYNPRPCQTGTIYIDKKCSRDSEGFYYCISFAGKKCGGIDRNNDGLLELCDTCY
jgi:hypothetical protein